VHLELESSADCNNELVEVERKKDLFEQSFQRRLLVNQNRKAKSA